MQHRVERSPPPSTSKTAEPVPDEFSISTGQLILDRFIVRYADRELKDLSIGCYSRADIMQDVASELRVQLGRLKVEGDFLFTSWIDSKQYPWKTHYAAYAIDRDSGSLMVLDPALSRTPLTISSWLDNLGVARDECPAITYQGLLFSGF